MEIMTTAHVYLTLCVELSVLLLTHWSTLWSHGEGGFSGGAYAEAAAAFGMYEGVHLRCCVVQGELYALAYSCMLCMR